MANILQILIQPLSCQLDGTYHFINLLNLVFFSFSCELSGTLKALPLKGWSRDRGCSLFIEIFEPGRIHFWAYSGLASTPSTHQTIIAGLTVNATHCLPCHRGSQLHWEATPDPALLFGLPRLALSFWQCWSIREVGDESRAQCFLKISSFAGSPFQIPCIVLESRAAKARLLSDLFSLEPSVTSRPRFLRCFF